jgi:hypothetical protein
MAAMSEEGDNIRTIFKKTIELEIEEQIFGSSTGLRKVSAWTL